MVVRDDDFGELQIAVRDNILHHKKFALKIERGGAAAYEAAT